MDIKAAVTGELKASKKLMIETLSARYPALSAFKAPESKREHVADALGVVVLVVQDDAVRLLARALEGNT